MQLIARNWRKPILIYVFFALEFAFTLPALVLFALADPDAYRSDLRVDGAMNGFNSSPMHALYEAANYRPVHTPVVWSAYITRYNVVISVLSTFLLLVKGIMFVLHLWVPILSFLVHTACMIMFAYSARMQTMPDLSDPDVPQTGAPWYITKGCDVAYYGKNVSGCRQAKASFAVTIILAFIFGVNAVWALYCSYPTKEEREERRLLKEEQAEVEVLEKWNPDADDEVYEMRQWPKTPQASTMPLSPTTPRTFAFRRLGGS